MAEAAGRTFDYVVVGGGSAGSILAARLSESPHRRVLLLEAGGWDSSWLLRIPFGVARVWNHPAFNWAYMSEPEADLGGRRIYHPRGKVIGGSGSINMMAFVRGHPAEYDHWAQSGMTDWSYEKVLPYFKRMETFAGGADAARGGTGPVNVLRRDASDPLIAAWLKAGQQAGHAVNLDYNGIEQEGVSVNQSNMWNGRRQSSAARYLSPARARPNLRIETGAEATRILLDGRRATGVEYQRDGQSFRVDATSEVVLCAGAYNTPKLLLLSGIGPAAELRRHGIDVALDAVGVGANLQDHLCVLVEYEAARTTDFHRNLRFDRLTLNMLRAAMLGTGPAAMPLGLGVAFLKSDARLAMPDTQIIFRPFARDTHPWFPLLRRPFQDRLAFVTCHLRPSARGTLRLASADPHAPPLIHNRFLELESDRLAMRSGVRMIRHIAGQPALSPHIGAEVLPGPSVATDEAVDDYIRNATVTIFHPCGTCRMGTDPASVVDPSLKLRGIDGLRIADASVMPQVVGGNINACVMMIAEKAADLIRS